MEILSKIIRDVYNKNVLLVLWKLCGLFEPALVSMQKGEGVVLSPIYILQGIL